MRTEVNKSNPGDRFSALGVNEDYGDYDYSGKHKMKDEFNRALREVRIL
jgi:hypothetical protein